MPKKTEAKKELKDYQKFSRAVVNADWETATEIYETMPDKEYEQASVVIHDLIKQFKHDALERVLTSYRSLNVNVLNFKGQPAIVMAFYVTNETAIDLLFQHGANVLATDGHGNTVVQYARWSKCRKTLKKAKEMLASAQAARTKPDFRTLAEKLLQKRQGAVEVNGVRHYRPDF